jgi:hypothetical protein
MKAPKHPTDHCNLTGGGVMIHFKTHRKPEVRAFAATAAEGVEKFRRRFASEVDGIHSRSRNDAPGINGPTRIDAAVYLNAVFSFLSSTSLQSAGLECVVDDQSVGLLPEAICRLLSLMTCQTISAAAYFPAKAIQSPIRISLRRRGTIVLCAISNPALAELSLYDAPGLQRLKRAAAGLQTSCMLRLMPERALIAIVLDTEGLESDILEAVGPYRPVQAA